jgi:outer membrane lipoprotein-sorting protein
MQTVRRALLVLLSTAVVPRRLAHAQTSSASPTDDPAAKIIVEAADAIRFPRTGFQVDIAISTRQDGEAIENRKYRVLSKGNENTVVMILEPASERGQIMLMRGRDLWIFLPEVSQPVRLSLAQRLTGQVANGDLARANFSGDYAPHVVRTEPIGQDEYSVLELTAVDRGVTYQRVLYWVAKSNNAPHKAEFYSASNRLLKTCSYEKFEKMLGALRPTRLVMRDALRKTEESILEYSDMKQRDLPDRVFTKEYLRRLQ